MQYPNAFFIHISTDMKLQRDYNIAVLPPEMKNEKDSKLATGEIEDNHNLT